MNLDDANDLDVMQMDDLHCDRLRGDDCAEPHFKQGRRRPSKPSGPRVDLAIREEVKAETLAELAECSHEYAMWLRVVMLRVLIRTPALAKLKGMSYNLSETCQFLGFENFEKFTADRTLAEIRDELAKVLERWEAQVGKDARFPAVLRKNLSDLAPIIGLNPLESDVLGLAILIHTEPALCTCCDFLGSELNGNHIERILSPMLGQKTDAIAKCLEKSERLASSGLLTIDFSGHYTLHNLIDLLTRTFAVRMLVAQTDIRKIVEGFVRPVPPTRLTEQDYAHVKTNFDICKALLRSAQEQRIEGTNILIYGRPGAGKTQLARLLASDLGLQLMEISTSNLAGEPISPNRRIRNFRIAQAFFKSQTSVILFDECEEILNHVNIAERGDEKTAVPRKSFINKVLETNEVPTIWIANSIRNFDEAYLRRFSVCFEMALPSQEQREKMLAKACGGLLGQQAQTSIARNKEATPAMLVQTASVVRAIAADKTDAERDSLAIHIMNNKLKAQLKSEINIQSDVGIAGRGYEPEWVNSEVNLRELRESLVQSRSGRICLWGPPGTGKTACGKWLAQELDMPHLVVKASELLGPYVGETEQNMAKAFDAARQQNALLQFDEVDSFLQDRQKAGKQWEVTQVNEMLTQMESFSGVFIASTNLFQNLDEASLRRFDMAIKFDYLKPEVAWTMFLKTCEILDISDANEMGMARVAELRCLTPGDFDQVIRRSRLLRPTSVAQLLHGLQSAVAMKKSATSRPMGFLTTV